MLQGELIVGELVAQGQLLRVGLDRRGVPTQAVQRHLASAVQYHRDLHFFTSVVAHYRRHDHSTQVDVDRYYELAWIGFRQVRGTQADGTDLLTASSSTTHEGGVFHQHGRMAQLVTDGVVQHHCYRFAVVQLAVGVACLRSPDRPVVDLILTDVFQPDVLVLVFARWVVRSRDQDTVVSQVRAEEDLVVVSIRTVHVQTTIHLQRVRHLTGVDIHTPRLALRTGTDAQQLVDDHVVLGHHRQLPRNERALASGDVDRGDDVPT
ncbi:hypothetical protein D3C84_405660 [compost metagenome]